MRLIQLDTILRAALKHPGKLNDDRIWSIFSLTPFIHKLYDYVFVLASFRLEESIISSW